jgi:hypothetical protein
LFREAGTLALGYFYFEELARRRMVVNFAKPAAAG